MPVSLFLNDNAKNGKEHNILWGFNAVERFFVTFSINFCHFFLKKRDRLAIRREQKKRYPGQGLSWRKEE